MSYDRRKVPNSGTPPPPSSVWVLVMVVIFIVLAIHWLRHSGVL